MSKEEYKYPDDFRLNDDVEITMTVEGDFAKLYEALGIKVPKKKLYGDELKDACNAITEDIKNLNRIMNERLSRSPLVIRIKKEDIKNEDILAQIRDHLVQNGEQKKEQKIAELMSALDIVERYNVCFHSTANYCPTRSCKKCEYHVEPGDFNKAVDQLAEYVKKSLNECENAVNRYIRNVSGGVELYDDIGQYVGYVHGFTDSGVTGSKETETIIRSIVESSWGLLTLNPHTLEKIIEDHGYISDLHFIVELYKDPSDIKLPEQWCLIKHKTKEGSK